MIFFDLFIKKFSKMDIFNRKKIEIDQIYIEITMVDTISLSKSESDRNLPSNSAGLES